MSCSLWGWQVDVSVKNWSFPLCLLGAGSKSPLQPVSLSRNAAIQIHHFISHYSHYIRRQFILHPLVLPPGNPPQIHRDHTKSLYSTEQVECWLARLGPGLPASAVACLVLSHFEFYLIIKRGEPDTPWRWWDHLLLHLFAFLILDRF